jgi:hypothetical protein
VPKQRFNLSFLNEEKMSFYTYLWKNDTWAKKDQLSKNGYSKLDYAASNNFKSAGVSEGSTVFIVTVEKGVLHLGGYINVQNILNRSQAARYLGQPENELWQADEYIVAEQESCVDFRADLVIPVEKAKKLEFQQKGHGFLNLKMDSDGKLDRQTLRNVRKLYPGSEKLLFNALKD